MFYWYGLSIRVWWPMMTSYQYQSVFGGLKWWLLLPFCCYEEYRLVFFRIVKDNQQQWATLNSKFQQKSVQFSVASDAQGPGAAMSKAPVSLLDVFQFKSDEETKLCFWDDFSANELNFWIDLTGANRPHFFVISHSFSLREKYAKATIGYNWPKSLSRGRWGKFHEFSKLRPDFAGSCWAMLGYVGFRTGSTFFSRFADICRIMQSEHEWIQVKTSDAKIADWCMYTPRRGITIQNWG